MYALHDWHLTTFREPCSTWLRPSGSTTHPVTMYVSDPAAQFDIMPTERHSSQSLWRTPISYTLRTRLQSRHARVQHRSMCLALHKAVCGFSWLLCVCACLCSSQAIATMASKQVCTRGRLRPIRALQVPSYCTIVMMLTSACACDGVFAARGRQKEARDQRRNSETHGQDCAS
jgi:hypothetical protein